MDDRVEALRSPTREPPQKRRARQSGLEQEATTNTKDTITIATYNIRSGRVSGYFYKAVVQSVLLYCCETWVKTDRVMQALRGFHNRVARRLSGHGATYDRSSKRWTWPPIEGALRAAGLRSIDHYVAVRERNFVDSFATRPILDLCKETLSERNDRSVSRIYLWTQTPLEREAVEDNVVDQA